MKNIVYIIFLCVPLLSNSNISEDIQKEIYIYSLVKWVGFDNNTAKMYSHAITKYSKKYCLDAKLIARQILRESYFDYRLTNKKTGAAGACQIMPFPEHDKIFRTTENYNDTVPVYEQYFWIYTSIETMCIIMSNYKTKYNSHVTAALAYWCGENSEQLKNYFVNKYDFQSTHYYKYIFVEGWVEKYIMGFKEIK